MIQRYNRRSLILGITGLLLQFASVSMRPPNPAKSDGSSEVAGLVGVVLLICGLGLYAMAKGRSPLWGLMGFFSLLGLIVLACLSDLTRSKETTTYSKAELDDVFGSVRDERISGQLVGNSCSICGNRVTSALDADFCERCGHPVHLPCKRPGSTSPGACPACGCTKPAVDFGGEVARAEPTARPAVVTAIAWLFFVGVGGTILGLLLTVNDPRLQAAIRDSTTLSPAAAHGQSAAAAVLLVVCGVGLLRGRNWARYLYLAAGGAGVVLNLMTGKNPASQTLGVVGFVIVCSCLFIPASVDRYFRGSASAK